jgi:hypothetical protein
MGFLSQDGNANSFRVNTNERDFQLAQDVSAYKAYAERSRQEDETASSKRQYRSFAIIPDIVSIDILTKYHINIHDEETMKDPVLMRRFKNIIISEYPHLLTSNVRSA